MRALVIGAGAIGQVFARHLQRGGAEVHLLVRPRQEADARAGLSMYPQNRPSRARSAPELLRADGVHVDQDAALATGFDLVVLAVSSVALRKGDWLARLGTQLGNGHLLALQAGPDDHDLVLQHVPADRLAWGMLSVISFQAPLPGQSLPTPGVAYWFPPLSKLGFSGPDAVVKPVLDVLSRGGMPVARVADVQADVAFAGAVLTQTIHALECADWSFDALRRDPELLPLAVQGMRESWALAEATTGARTPLAMRLLRPFALRLALRLSRWVVPFDLEQFFHYHYEKVAEQTLLVADAHLRHAEEAGVDATATAELIRRLRSRRAAT